VLIGGLFYGEDSVDTRDEFVATDLLALLGLAGVTSSGTVQPGHDLRRALPPQRVELHRQLEADGGRALPDEADFDGASPS
jgi:hypothetical protein